MKFLLGTAMITFLTVVAFAQNKSIYTSIRTGACKTIESNPDEGGSYLGECAGAAGYKIQLLEGDIRQTINIITPARKKFELNFWGFYGGFSSVGEKIEWRTNNRKPLALIARFNVANPEDSAKSTSYLMVVKIGKTSSCVTDVVLPAAGQNETARKLADTAADRPCKRVQ